MDIADLEVGYVETEAEYNGHKIAFRFRSDVTGRTISSLDALRTQVDPKPLWAELSRLIVAWDLKSRGEPIPVSEAAWQDLPADIAGSFFQAILTAISDPNKRAPLRGGSSQAASSEPIAFPASTESSRTPDGPESPRGISSGWGTHETRPAGATG